MNANSDVEAIHKAMKGLGTDEKALVDILGNRTVLQMGDIRKQFKVAYGKNLSEAVKSEVSGHFGHLCYSLTLPPAEFDADCIHKAIKGLGTDEELLIETLVGRTNAEMAAIKTAYKDKYNVDMEKAVASDLGGKIKHLFVSLIQGARDESGQTGNVDGDVDALYKAGEARMMGVDESVFFLVLNTRSDVHLRQVFASYLAKHGKDINHVIQHKFGGELEKSLLSLVECVENRPDYVAQLFEKSMHGLGTKEDMLSRLAVRCRDPNLMCSVKEAFAKRYGKTLEHRVKGETGGNYEKLLVAVIGN